MLYYNYLTPANSQDGPLTITEPQPLPPEQTRSKLIFRYLPRLHPTLWLVIIALGLAVSIWLRSGDVTIDGFTSLGTFGPLFVVLTTLTTINLTVRWLRWHFLTRRLNLRLPTKDSFRLYGITLPAFVTPLSLGELLRAPLVARHHPHAPATIYRVWLVERLVDVSVLGLLLLAARSQWMTISALVGLAVLLIYILRTTFKTRTIQTLVQPATLSVVAVSSLCIWLLPALGLWLILRQLETPVSLAVAAETFSMSTLLSGLTTGPLSLGITGPGILTQLQTIGMSPVRASLVTSVFQAGTTWYALGLGLLALIRWRGHLTTMLEPPQAINHFDTIAPTYNQQIPAHVRERLLTRKVTAMRDILTASGIPPDARGLDLGCGPGWYACEMARLGYTMSACDLAHQQIKHAHNYAAQENVSIAPQIADARILPYADNSFDFIYGINLIHHITDKQTRRKTFDEIVRVLEPGGIFFLQEINTENPLFAFYMGYLFPLLRDIDEGTEWWVKPSALPEIEGARWASDTTHFTFIPDFTPQRLLKALTELERVLETSMQRWSAHYVAHFVKEGGL